MNTMTTQAERIAELEQGDLEYMHELLREGRWLCECMDQQELHGERGCLCDGCPCLVFRQTDNIEDLLEDWQKDRADRTGKEPQDA